MINIIKVANILMFLWICFIIHTLQNTNYVNCVVINDEKNYSGLYLKNSENATTHRMLSSECSALDKQLDDSTGDKIGKVRWIKCLNGPDCDELGNY